MAESFADRSQGLGRVTASSNSSIDVTRNDVDFPESEMATLNHTGAPPSSGPRTDRLARPHRAVPNDGGPDALVTSGRIAGGHCVAPE